MGQDTPNAAQGEFWTSGPGLKWVARQEALDALFAEPLDALLAAARIAPGEQVLDIGCGGGRSTVAFARAAGPGGGALGVDISSSLLAAAERLEAQEASGARFLLADAQVHPFEPGRFDVALSRFGVMFFDDPVAAFRNIARALRPGGRLAFLCWRSLSENPWFADPRALAVARFGAPEPADPHAPGPMAFADADRVCGLLTEAGLEAASAETVSLSLRPPGSPERAAALAVEIGPAGRIFVDAGASEAEKGAVAADLAAEWRRYAGPDGVRLPASFNLFTATRGTP
ncbi:Demethylmenaquinone methyltransferase [Pseudoruegeria aquimaris]|uniref:Demethylmenaquinone methyltransferase n=1 Tax=Pseudoruegeria aquimaris TaxID=393663 RepID=A0A1Y5S9Z2_9RHOB|nr:class I SAM-dependent methyltransferase [Pseudoruegeria aquimaris]SLN35902.1 Demethylmenaquinone methyltransferase [Pseudoruegeria aquimaris]